MALIKCEECDKEISENAKTCPSCGAPVRKKPKQYGFGTMFLAFFIIAIIITVLLDSETGTETSTMVQWNLYSPIVKNRIDKATSENDCKNLQTEIDAAFQNNAIHLARSGEDNSKLITYLNDIMNKIDCSK